MGDPFLPNVDNTTLKTLDDLIRRRAEEDTQIPIIAYPKSAQGVTDYEYFTGRDIDRLVDGAAKSLITCGLEPVYDSPVVALYGKSDRDYLINFLALVRLGYAGLMLSPSLEATACLALMEKLNAQAFFSTPLGAQTAREIIGSRPSVKMLQLLTRSQYDFPACEPGKRFSRKGIDPGSESAHIFGFIHSSGSSGAPKPLSYTHKRFMSLMKHARSVTHFLTLPIYHALGMVMLFHCFYKRNTCYIFNGNVPQTHGTLTRALKAANDPHYVITVPYALKLWAEKQDGIDALKATKLVVTGGSRLLDEEGDRLVNHGIRLAQNYGATEIGHVMTSSYRPVDDKGWNYLEPPAHIAPYIHWRPYAEGLYECIVLDGHGGKEVSNSDDPPNSFHTSDLFEPHPTLKNRWKFIGRIDDRVTLSTGEKVLPLEIEARIRKHHLVREAVIFGVDRPVPGLLLAKADGARHFSNEEFIEEVWPTIQYANSLSQAFSQITREMIMVLPEGAEVAVTDKMSVKRAKVYKMFSGLIDEVYKNLEELVGGDLRLDPPQLEEWIIKTFKKSLGVALEPETDFFFAGIDSLKAIQMRGILIRTLDLGGTDKVKKCGAMMVSDCANAKRLAQFLYALRVGEEDRPSDEIEAMQAAIEELAVFDHHIPGKAPAPQNCTVVLTGVTGSLGSHLLHALANSPMVSQVYCLVRAQSTADAESRITRALHGYGLSLPAIPFQKIQAFPSDHSTGKLSLPPPALERLQSSLTHIIHAAWPVNFTLPLQSFLPQLRTLQALVNLAQSVKTADPAHILFCSSVGAANGAPSGTSVAEAPVPELTWSTPTGYGRSKLVGERMLESAKEKVGAHTTVLRIGQIVPAMGKSNSKLWNPVEMVPLMVRSVGVTSALPNELRGGDACSWLPVDTLANAIVEIAQVDPQEHRGRHQLKTSDQLVYNLVHPLHFSWEADFIPALRSAGLEFEQVTWQEWVWRLEQSDDDLKKNPSRKLLGFWQRGGPKKRHMNGVSAKGEKGDTVTADMRGTGVVFETDKARRDSRTMREAVRVVGTGQENGYVAELLRAWRESWTA